MALSFEPLEGEAGLTVVDPIERRKYVLRTGDAVRATRASDAGFVFPVDDAVRIRTDSITLPNVIAVLVRDADGRMLAEAEHFAHQEFPEGEYSVELCAPIKLYLRVDSRLTVSAGADRMSLSFGEETELLVGGRSHHKHPEATITTTSDPTDVMRAVSQLSSALKTASPERSYPTLRGHPPAIELGDELEIPESLRTPETGVTLEIPPTYEAIYVAAPLAYYLGAELVPANTPRLVTEQGLEYPLDTVRGYEREIERVLKQTFFLDCLTRTEGYYQVDLHERTAVEALVDLDFAALYDQSIADQLAAYLSVPYEVVEAHVPEWKLTTHVAPTAANVETLPYAVNDLAIVRTPRARQVNSSGTQVTAIEEFMRGEFTRSSSESPTEELELVETQSTDSVEQAWFGDGAPLNASKASVRAFRNRLERTVTDGSIQITVVSNDPEMDEERDLVDDVYGSRAELPFDVRVHHELTVAELRDVLESEAEFLHYIGHIDAEGFECADGKLDARTLDSVGVDAFLLNACQSYDQGMALIDAGSVGGIVTLSDVINSGAVEMGKTIARLLNRGFPLRAALSIAKDESIVGGQYIVVGDGNVDIAQAESGSPVLCEVTESDGGYELAFRTYTTSQNGMGSLFTPQIRENGEFYLNSGLLDTFEMSSAELRRFLKLENLPIRWNGRFTWSKYLNFEDR